MNWNASQPRQVFFQAANRDKCHKIFTPTVPILNENNFIKFPYHTVSNINYLQASNFIIESLKSTFVLTTRHIHFTEVRNLSVIMGKLNWGILYDPFVLVNIINLKTNLNELQAMMVAHHIF